MWKQTTDREFGIIHPKLFRSNVCRSRVSSIHLSNCKEIVSSHRGSVNSLQVDLTEGRYLLAGASDATVAVYDIQRPTEHEDGNAMAKHKSLFVVSKQHEHGHHFAVSSAIWYPIDTGLFVTGSYDHHVNVWDTNTTQRVVGFNLPGKVYRIAMSSVATSHMLVATGTEDVQVRLCDIASGAFSHTLSGHRDGVMSLEWSTSSEWVLITGGCDGAIRFWDIRKAGCFQVLDQSQTQLGHRPPLLVHPKTEKKSSSTGLSSTGKPRAKLKRLNNRNTEKFQPSARSTSQMKHIKQRSHPGMSSIHDRATGHYGRVTGLKMTEDGMHLLSAGSDSRLRLWDMDSGCNTLVNFEATRLQGSKPIQMAMTQDSDLAFVPCLVSVKAFSLWYGQAMATFRAHYENVNCCCYSVLDQELYSGGNDWEILIWSPTTLSCTDSSLDEGKNAKATIDQDNWSD